MTAAHAQFVPPHVLEIRGLSVDTEHVQILQGIDFSLEQGRILGIVGESGAGKSLLSKVLGRALPEGFRVSRGSLIFAGQDLLAGPSSAHRDLLGKRICFVPQDAQQALNPVLSIGQQLNEHFERLGIPPGSWPAMGQDTLRSVQLAQPERVLRQFPHQLSGGMCQRVLLAMVFVSQPDLIVCDEATTALDPVTQLKIVSLLRDLQRDRRTSVLFITHDLDLAAHLCDQLLVLYAGTMVEYGNTEKILLAPGHPYTRALLNARPALTGDWQPLQPLSGQMPSMESLANLKGCRFAPRCGQVESSCHHPPPLQQQADGRWLRCCGGQQVSVAADSPVNLDARYALGLLGGAPPFLRVENLSQNDRVGRWPNRHLEPRLQGIDFSIAPGEFIGLVGPSGSGKSSLARILMGLHAPDTGRLWLNGEPLGLDRASWERRRQAVQLTFQNSSTTLNPRRTVSELLTQSLDHQAVLRSERKARGETLAKAVGLPLELFSRLPEQLSGGQRQRLNIGRALCNLPQLLIADEIVSGLDVSVQAQILNLLLALRREHKIALLLISHDLGVVRYLCGRVMVMDQGRIVESGDTAKVFSAPKHPVTRQLLEAARYEVEHA
ncbi:ABC transporter ATP-binding protein [Pseudomonas sp. ADAK13]|uniref:ABC transporter ATP-binding protein n=1 Tax=Pseudomonas sp. ADAK13 TaxID=2730847 RepID=UPI001462D68C|nr:ABC transporter ATP-binding protein [Pseudomonas sp. ADAK13]QJI37106.1 ABC transporter ATP-binding protein [Pseudomonas sp. ADAK13]